MHANLDPNLGFNIFTILFLGGTFAAALVAGLGGFAFGIVAAAMWLTPLQTATLIMGLGLVVQGYSVWKLRHALDGRRLAPLLIGTALGVPLGVFLLAHGDPRYLRLGTGVVLVLFSLYGLLRPSLTPIKAAPLSGVSSITLRNCSSVMVAPVASCGLITVTVRGAMAA